MIIWKTKGYIILEDFKTKKGINFNPGQTFEEHKKVIKRDGKYMRKFIAVERHKKFYLFRYDQVIQNCTKFYG